MIPQKNQYVKLIFKNSTKVEGFVKSWNNKKIVLKAADSDNILTIHYPCEILVSILVPGKELTPRVSIEEVKKQIVERIKELPLEATPSSMPIEKATELAKLKIQLIEHEKETIRTKSKDFSSLGPQQVVYGLPNFNSNPIVKQHSEEKISGKD